MVDLITRINIELPPHHSAKVPGWFFYALKHYFKFAKTNVSNARMNIPKAIRSLKSNGFLSISTTPILCRIEVSHPATRLSLSIYYHKHMPHTISISVSSGTTEPPGILWYQEKPGTLNLQRFRLFLSR